MRIVLAAVVVLVINYAVPGFIRPVVAALAPEWVTQFFTNFISFFAASLILQSRARAIGFSLLAGFTLIYATGIYIATQDSGAMIESGSLVRIYAESLVPYFSGGLLGVVVGVAVAKRGPGEPIDGP